jgi:hypothetical protein
MKTNNSSTSCLLTTCPFPGEDRPREEGILLNHGVQMGWVSVLGHLAWVVETHQPPRGEGSGNRGNRLGEGEAGLIQEAGSEAGAGNLPEEECRRHWMGSEAGRGDRRERQGLYR